MLWHCRFGYQHSPWSVFLTQPSLLAPSSDYLSHNEQLHQQVLQANERVDQANQKYAMLEDKIKSMEQKLVMMMEWQQGDTSIGTTHVHPHYARNFGDQLLP